MRARTNKVSIEREVRAIEKKKTTRTEVFKELIAPVAQKYMNMGKPWKIASQMAIAELLLFK